MSTFEQLHYTGWGVDYRDEVEKLEEFISIQDIAQNLKILISEIRKLQDEKQKLEDAGIVNATVQMKKGGYMQLYHPQEQGKRKREYIGKDMDDRHHALESIERYKEWNKKKGELENLNNRVERLKLQYTTFLNNLDPNNSMTAWYGF